MLCYREKPTVAEMLDYLRTKFPEGKAILLRSPSTCSFIEMTRKQYDAVNEFEQLCAGAALGRASPLQRIGIEMLLGWDYDNFAGGPDAD